MTIVIDFTTAFISEHGSVEMLKLWNSKATQAELKKTTSAKKIKDPQAPKKPLSAYMYFCKDQRAAVMKDKGDDTKATDVTSELGARWNSLKEDHSKGKAKKQWEGYEAEAADDKKRYETEMADYTPPSDEEMAELAAAAPAKKTRKTSSAKDPLAPKRGKSAYLFFCAAQRETVKADLLAKGEPTSQVMTELGVRWNDLKTDPSRSDELKHHIEEAVEDKKRYEDEIKDYTPPSDDELEAAKPIKTKAKPKPKPVEPEIDSQETEEDEPVPEPVPEPVKKKSSGKKKSGQSLYCTEFRADVKDDYPTLKGAEITKKLSEMWKDLPKEEKDDWAARANA